MRQFYLALLCFGIIGEVFAQTVPDSSTSMLVEYPYNPDSNGDASIGAPDLLDFLPSFNSNFQPQSIMVDSITLEAWLLMLQSRLDNLETNSGSGFGRDDVTRWVFGKELGGADLGGLDLRYSGFQYADLQGANFANAQLQGADLRWADMTGANFYGANFGPNNDCGKSTPPFSSNSAIINTETVFDGANLACLRGCGCLPPGWVCTIDSECSELRYKWVQPEVDGMLVYSDSVYDGHLFRGVVFLPGPEGATSVTASSFVGASISGSELSLCPFVDCDFTNARIDTSMTAGLTNCVLEGFEASQWQGGDFDGCNLNGAKLNFSEDSDVSFGYNPIRIKNCSASELRLEGNAAVNLAEGNEIHRLQISCGVQPQFQNWLDGEFENSQIDSLFVLGQVGVTAQDLFDTLQMSNSIYLQSVESDRVGIEYIEVSNGKLNLWSGCDYCDEQGLGSVVLAADSSLIQLSSVSAKSVELLDCKLIGNWGVEVADYISFAGCDASAASFSNIERVSVCPALMPEGWLCAEVNEECDVSANGPYEIRSKADSLQTVDWFGSEGDVLTGCDALLNANYSYDSTLFDSINVLLPESYVLAGDYSGSWEFNNSQFNAVTLQGSCWNPVVNGCDNGIEVIISFNESDMIGSDLQLSKRANVMFQGGRLVDSNIEFVPEQSAYSYFGLFADSVLNCYVEAEEVDLYLSHAESLTVEARNEVELGFGEFENLAISAQSLVLTNDGPLSLNGCSISAAEISGTSDDTVVVTELLQGITPEAWADGLQFQLVFGGGLVAVALDAVSTCPAGIHSPWSCSDDSGAVVVTGGN